MSFAGSSPLTRGKRADDALRLSNPGLIPAHAGKTFSVHARRRHPEAHPRSRGENCAAESSMGSHGGSSPLTRGKRGFGDLAGRVARLIPAHAGKTTRSVASRASRAAHPRSRGENPRPRATPCPAWGSSPLTRGKLSRPGTKSGTGLAHPRSRGENYQAHATALQAGGSSPLTRGKHVVDGQRVRGLGLIPAHAGKTEWSAGVDVWNAAHPRSRGENSDVGSVAQTTAGSSPLTRGKPIL